MESGWILVHRKVMNHWIWKDPIKFKWWLDIVFMANFTDGKMLQGNALIEIRRGSFHTSEVKLAERWCVTRRTVNTFLNLLEKDEMVSLKRTRNGTTIKVLNYNDYQSLKGEKCTTDDATNDTAHDTAHDTAQGTAHDTQYKELKEVKERKRNKESIRFTPPSLDEVKNYCKERNNTIDAESFIDFYSSKDWMVGKNKMKDWKASIRTWEKRNGVSRPSQKKDLNDDGYIPI